MESSKEKTLPNGLQDLALMVFIRDESLLARTANVMKEEFFDTNIQNRLIYKSLIKYYTRYDKLPKQSELNLIVSSLFKEEVYGDLSEIINHLNLLYEKELPEHDFILDQLTEFISQANFQYLLEGLLVLMDEGKLDIVNFKTLMNSIEDIEIFNTKSLKLSDTSKLEDILSLNDPNAVRINTCLTTLDTCLDYGGLSAGNVAVVTAPPGIGKTTFLINQGLCVAKQGHNTLTVFLGDMTRETAIHKFLACISGKSIKSLINLNKNQLKLEIEKVNTSGVLSKIHVLEFPADSLTSSQLLEEIKTYQKTASIHFDQIIIDYDGNIIGESENSYESGGALYNKMKNFATVNGSVVWIAAQPNKNYWSSIEIPLEGLADSSKKQRVVDLMISINKVKHGSDYGNLFIAKNRFGLSNRSIRLKFDGKSSKISEISDREYEEAIANEVK